MSTLPKDSITKEVLLSLLKAGLVLSVAMVAPNALRVLKPLGQKPKEWEEYYPSSIERVTLRLWRKGHVEVKEGRDGYTVVITEKGRSEVLKYDVEAMSIPRQKRWDGKWRMVFFDISEDKARQKFRETLRSMGFFPMQKSVYVQPFPCREQIEFLREVLSIPHYVKLATVESLENDADLRRFFRL